MTLLEGVAQAMGMGVISSHWSLVFRERRPDTPTLGTSSPSTRSCPLIRVMLRAARAHW